MSRGVVADAMSGGLVADAMSGGLDAVAQLSVNDNATPSKAPDERGRWGFKLLPGEPPSTRHSDRCANRPSVAAGRIHLDFEDATRVARDVANQSGRDFDK